MDAICRAQPDDAAHLSYVESALMRRCCTAVLLHSVRIQHLPHTVRQQACAITITVNGISYTTPAAHATAEEEVINSVTGERSPALGPCLSASRKKPCDVFGLHYAHLQLIFPGERIPAYAMSQPPQDLVIDNPREFANGIHVSVHTVDLNHVYGTALCKTSGEVAYLSYPRGAVTLHFRVYPCVGGEVVLRPLYNKPSFATLYLQGGEGTAVARLTQGPAAATEQAAAPPVADTAAAEEENDENVVDEVANAPVVNAAAPPTACDVEAVTTPVRAVIPPGTQRPMVVEMDELMQAVMAFVPCFTEAQRQAVFDLYDTEKTGFLTRDQLLHFCKAHVALSDTWSSEYDVMEYLSPYVPPPTPPVSRERDGARPRSARGYTYYRPATPDTDAPLQINMELFTLICLKLVRT